MREMADSMATTVSGEERREIKREEVRQGAVISY